MVSRRTETGKTLLAALLSVVLAAFLLVARPPQTGRAEFRERYGEYVEANRRLLRTELGKKRSRVRDLRIAAFRANLRWAEEYERQGYDPEIDEDARFQAALDRGERP